MKFIGYCLPGISFKNYEFSEPLYFNKATFYGKTNFFGARFSRQADFSYVNFSDKTYFPDAIFTSGADFSGAKLSETYFPDAKFSNGGNFSGSTFSKEAYFSGEFNYVIFGEPTKVTFDISNMSNVSFSDSDITRIRFGNKVTWGGDDKFTIIEEKRLMKEVERIKENKLKNEPIEKRDNEGQSVSLELVLSVYRNLRENYEFRLRYGDAGKFFIKEMELKRKYREAPSISTFKLKLIVSQPILEHRKV